MAFNRSTRHRPGAVRRAPFKRTSNRAECDHSINDNKIDRPAEHGGRPETDLWLCLCCSWTRQYQHSDRLLSGAISSLVVRLPESRYEIRVCSTFRDVTMPPLRIQFGRKRSARSELEINEHQSHSFSFDRLMIA